MTVRIFSFSYKHGLPSDLGPDGGGFVFDCRALPNPFWVENLRGFTGRDQPIIGFFAVHADAVAAFLKPVEDLVRNSISAYAQDARERLSVGFAALGASTALSTARKPWRARCAATVALRSNSSTRHSKPFGSQNKTAMVVKTTKPDFKRRLVPGRGFCYNARVLNPKPSGKPRFPTSRRA